MAALSDYAEGQILNALFNADVGDLPIANLYAKLHVGPPGENGTANAAAHTTRVAASFGAQAGGSIANDAPISWTGLTANETITHASIWDASSGGNCITQGALDESKAVTIGSSLTIGTGNLTIAAD